MEAGKVIYKLLKDSTDVGDIAGDRIYPEIANQVDAMPLVVYTIESADPSGTKQGTSTLDVVQFDVMCMSTDYAQCMTLGTATRGALDRIGGTISGVPVQSIDFLSQAVDFDYPTDAHVLIQTYRMRLQFTGTVNTYGAIYDAPSYDIIQVGLRPDKLTGGSDMFTFSGSTPVVVPLDLEHLKSTPAMDLLSGGIVNTTLTGYYRITATVTFSADQNNVHPACHIIVETRQLNTIGGTFIHHAGDVSSVCISELTEIDSTSRIMLRVYDADNGSHATSISAVTFAVERVVQ
jgi:hypothetical protein